jgi:E3 ubiquitin-protein ligase RGLG
MFLSLLFDIVEIRLSNMGNTESMSESQHEFYYQHPPSYDGSSVSNTYHQPSSYAGSLDGTTYDQPSSYTGISGNTNHQQPSSHATSSRNTHNRHNQKPTYIADNFSSLDQVSTANFAMRFVEGRQYLSKS